MSEMDRELGWDDVIEKDSNFVTLPEGDYDFVIDHFERARHPGLPGYGTRRTGDNNPGRVYSAYKTGMEVIRTVLRRRAEKER